MKAIRLEGIDHFASIDSESWETLLGLACKEGWEPDEPLAFIFRPRMSLTLPSWTYPRADSQKTVEAEEAKEFARYLGQAIARYRKTPPRWWKSRQANRKEMWMPLVPLAWEVAYLFGAGTVRLTASDDREDVSQDLLAR